MEDSTKSPSKAQRRGACGHIMAAFDQHQRCARCRENKKGQDLCVRGEDCNLCDALTPEQQKQLATPKYRDRKEKKAASHSSMDVDPSSVTVIGPPTQEDRAALASSSVPKGKSKKSTSTPVKAKDPGPGAAGAPTKLLASPPPDRTDLNLPLSHDVAVSQVDLTAMAMSIRTELAKQDQEREEERCRREQAREDAWMERFARLEAKLVSASLSQHPSTSRPDPEPERKPVKNPTPDPEDSDEQQEAEIELDAHESDLDKSDTEPSPDSEDQAVDSRPPPSSSFQNQPGASSLRSQEPTSSDEDLSYRETMSALRHTLGLRIPDKEGPVVAKNMPWINTKSSPSGKLALHLPPDDHLCSLMADLQISVSEGNTNRNSEPSALSRGQFLRGPPKSKWYHMYQDQEAIRDHPGEVKWWTQEAQRLNTTFQNLCRPAASCLLHPWPSHRTI